MKRLLFMVINMQTNIFNVIGSRIMAKHIICKFLPATNNKNDRVKATAYGQSIVINWASNLDVEDNYIMAKNALCKKLGWESDSWIYSATNTGGIFIEAKRLCHYTNEEILNELLYRCNRPVNEYNLIMEKGNSFGVPNSEGFKPYQFTIKKIN